MTFATWLTPSESQALASALLHFLWQGAAVAVLLAGANVLLRASAARTRYAAACAALVLMLALPAATFVRFSGPSARTPAAGIARPRPAATTAEPSRPEQAGLATALAGEAAPWIVLVWLAGVSVLSIRFLGGWCAVERLRRRGTAPASREAVARLELLLRRFPTARPVRLLESARVAVPTAIGVLRPLILLPAGIATGITADQLDSLLAHELAHVRRRDFLVSFFQALAEALLFYHPAVWWVSHRIRVERENACDDLAVLATGDAIQYARALVALEERRERLPRLALAADGGPLWSRIARLFPAPELEARRAPRWVAALLAMASLAVLAAAAHVPASPSDQAPSLLVAGVPATASAPAPGRQEAKTTAEPSAKATPAPAPGLLSPQQLIAFRIHGVTPEFVGEIAALGYTKISPDDLVGLRIHDVTAAFITQMTEVFGKLPLEEYTAFRIHGLTPATVKELQAIFGNLSADDALAMRIHGVDAAFVQSFREAGYTSLSAEEAVAFKIHGVTPRYARQTNQELGGRLSAEELIDSRIHGEDEEDR